jgi:hypothetical protein
MIKYWKVIDILKAKVGLLVSKTSNQVIEESIARNVEFVGNPRMRQGLSKYQLKLMVW